MHTVSLKKKKKTHLTLSASSLLLFFSFYLRQTVRSWKSGSANVLDRSNNCSFRQKKMEEKIELTTNTHQNEKAGPNTEKSSQIIVVTQVAQITNKSTDDDG